MKISLTLAVALLWLGATTTRSAAVDLAAGLAAEKTESRTATFSMYCYWTGEATLGRVDGVLASRIGHWSGSEIVQVDFDPEITSLEQLVGALKAQRSFYSVVVADEAERRAAGAIDTGEISRKKGRPHFIESKYSLRRGHPELAALDLTERQAILLNSWSYFGGEMPDVLTPDQVKRLSSR